MRQASAGKMQMRRVRMMDWQLHLPLSISKGKIDRRAQPVTRNAGNQTDAILNCLMRQIQQGPFDDLSPDMMLGFDVGYRVSWGTTTGGMKLSRQDDGSYAPGNIYEDSNKNWSGDHVSVDPTLVQGMFFSNRKVEVPAEGIHVMHIAPTALQVLGVPVPPAYDKQPLKLQ